MNPIRRRLLVEHIVAVAVLECGMKVDAMWHVPQEVVKGEERIDEYRMGRRVLMADVSEERV